MIRDMKSSASLFGVLLPFIAATSVIIASYSKNFAVALVCLRNAKGCNHFYRGRPILAEPETTCSSPNRKSALRRNDDRSQSIFGSLSSPDSSTKISDIPSIHPFALDHIRETERACVELTQKLDVPYDPSVRPAIYFRERKRIQQRLKNLQHPVDDAYVQLHTMTAIRATYDAEVLTSYEERYERIEQALVNTTSFRSGKLERFVEYWAKELVEINKIHGGRAKRVNPVEAENEFDHLSARVNDMTSSNLSAPQAEQSQLVRAPIADGNQKFSGRMGRRYVTHKQYLQKRQQERKAFMIDLVDEIRFWSIIPLMLGFAFFELAAWKEMLAAL